MFRHQNKMGADSGPSNASSGGLGLSIKVLWCYADFEDVPMRNLAFAILIMVISAGQACAQTYDPAFPVCMHVIQWGGGSHEDCTYYTMAQCAMSASGRAAQCDPNPYYAGATASPRRNDRRYRRVY